MERTGFGMGDMPILLATGNLDRAGLELQQSTGIEALIRKPYEVERLGAAINRCL